MGDQNITINVSLIDDGDVEEKEMFMGQLKLQEEHPRVQLTNPTTTIVILDNGKLPRPSYRTVHKILCTETPLSNGSKDSSFPMIEL